MRVFSIRLYILSHMRHRTLAKSKPSSLEDGVIDQAPLILRRMMETDD